jgi:hypothetical protein
VEAMMEFCICSDVEVHVEVNFYLSANSAPCRFKVVVETPPRSNPHLR